MVDLGLVFMEEVVKVLYKPFKAVLSYRRRPMLTRGGGFFHGSSTRLKRFGCRILLGRYLQDVVVSLVSRNRVGTQHNQSFKLTRDRVAALRGRIWWRAA